VTVVPLVAVNSPEDNLTPFTNTSRKFTLYTKLNNVCDADADVVSPVLVCGNRSSKVFQLTPTPVEARI
jgi:tryptophan synthase alpha subunit